MNTLVCTAPGHFAYTSAAMPEPQQGEVLLRIHRVGICGTDLHAFEGTQPFFTYPRILGHELAAEIVDASQAPDFATGEHVTIVPYFNCGNCIACKNGKPNCCTTLQVGGVHVDGGLAEYLVVPASALVHGGTLSLNELALVEPLAIGAHAVWRAQIQPHEIVLVIGAGPIGLGLIAFAKIAGATVIAMDVNDQRLDFAHKVSGAQYTINPAHDSTIDQLMEITHGQMPGVVIDATGNLNAINEGFRYIAHGGRYVLVGLQKGNIAFNHPEFHKREATLMSSRNATHRDFYHVLTAINNQQIQPAQYITHRVQFNQVKEVFAEWLQPDSGVIKAMVSL